MPIKRLKTQGVNGVGPMASLNDLRPLSIQVSGVASGNVDIYTVPSGRKAYITGLLVFNNSGGAVTLFPQIKISGTYYQVANTVAPANGGPASSLFFRSIVLNAGESISVNTTASGLNISISGYEYDANSPLKRYDIKSLINGDNTLLTVPTGKNISLNNSSIISLGTGQLQASWASIVGFQSSGSTVNLSLYLPRNGASKSSSNLMDTISMSSGSIFGYDVPLTFSAGDSIIMNTTSTVATCLFWTNAYEF